MPMLIVPNTAIHPQPSVNLSELDSHTSRRSTTSSGPSTHVNFVPILNPLLVIIWRAPNIRLHDPDIACLLEHIEGSVVQSIVVPAVLEDVQVELIRVHRATLELMDDVSQVVTCPSAVAEAWRNGVLREVDALSSATATKERRP